MKKLLLSLIILFAVSGNYASAQTTNPAFCKNGSCTYIALEPLPIGGGYSNCYGAANEVCASPVSFQSLVSRGFQLLLGAGATIAVVMLIIGAITYMFSDVLHKKKDALSRVRNAMWAIVLLVSSYLILNTINPDLVTFKLDLTAITQQPTAGQQNTLTSTQSAAKLGPVGSTLTIGTEYTSTPAQSQYETFKSWCNGKGGAVNTFTGEGTYSCQSVNQ